MENRFEALNSGEVLSVDDSIVFLTGHGTFKIAEFTKLLKEKMLATGDITEDKLGWLTEEGIKCEVLKFGSGGWQKGKVRLHLEFSPDESADASLSQKKTEVVVKPPQPKIEVKEAVEPELNLIEESEDFTASVMEQEEVFAEAEISLDDSFDALEIEETPLDLGEEFEAGEVFAETEEESAGIGDIFGGEEESFEDIGQSIDSELDKFESGEESFDFGESEEESLGLEGFGSEEESSLDLEGFGESEEESSLDLEDFGESEEESSLDLEGFGESEEESLGLEGFGESEEESSLDLEGFGSEEESLGLEGFGDEEGGDSLGFEGLGDEEDSISFEGFDEEFSLGDEIEANPFEDSDDNLFGEADSDNNLFGDDDIDDVWKDMQDLN